MPGGVKKIRVGESSMFSELIELVQELGQPKVLVIGDVMLDRYIWGDAARISQEAPVILLRADKREERLGGASSVATMLRALGAQVSVAGVVGADANGGRIKQLLAELGISHEGILVDESRPSTVKERYIGRAQHRHPQQMLRVDYEETGALSPSLEMELAHFITRQIAAVDIVLISDYAKGFCTPNLLCQTIARASEVGVRTVVDPTRGGDFAKYKNCSAMTPNRLEASLATGLTLQGEPLIFAAAEKLLNSLEMEAAIITLDKDGMALASRNGQRKIVPTKPRQVYDITGAGDMVLSVLGMALAAGADYETAIALANVAGGLEVEKIGVATVTRDEILRDLLHNSSAGDRSLSPLDKILPLEKLCQEVETRRKVGQKVVFTNGCFDVLHAGHVEYLEEARRQGDFLVVGLNSDTSIRTLKGSHRPVNPLDARIKVLSGLQAVQYVVVFEEESPLRLIQALRPDVLVKGSDYHREEVVGGDLVESYGGQVYLAPIRPGYSTTGLLEKMRAA
jgi:D-beta-D-heptose 7-phosphate kinase/D-beta-D-heptose 1-phosphate adenosyltransferase